jgi:hypothetical protein
MHHKEPSTVEDEVTISRAQLTAWAESLIHMNHHGTLVQREIEAGNFERAADLAERARKRAWKMLNELFEQGAQKPEGYCEPDSNA